MTASARSIVVVLIMRFHGFQNPMHAQPADAELCRYIGRPSFLGGHGEHLGAIDAWLTAGVFLPTEFRIGLDALDALALSLTAHICLELCKAGRRDGTQGRDGQPRLVQPHVRQIARPGERRDPSWIGPPRRSATDITEVRGC